MSDDLIKIDIKKIADSVQTNFKKSALVTLSVAVLVGPLLFLLPNKYTSKATVLPSQQGGGLSELGAVAGLIGVSIPEFGGQGTNDELIPDILYSERLLDLLISQKWKYSEYDSLVSLYTVFDVEPTSRSINPAREMKELLIESFRKDLLNATIERETGLITVTLTVPNDPYLAKNLLDTILVNLDKYNRQFRKTKSTAEFLFLEKRLQEVQSELTTSEAALARFETDNKNWQQSPGLQNQWKKFNREVLVNTTVWSELRKQFELVKINLEKEKQTVDILDSPTLASKKSGPKRLYMLIGISFLVFLSMQTFLFLNLNLTRFLKPFRKSGSK